MTLCDPVSLVAIDRATAGTFDVEASEWEYTSEINDIDEASFQSTNSCADPTVFVPWCTQVAFTSGQAVMWQGWVSAIDITDTGYTVDLVNTLAILGREVWAEAGTLSGQARIVVGLIVAKLEELTGFVLPVVELNDLTTEVLVSYAPGDTLLDTLETLTDSALFFVGIGGQLVIGDPTAQIQRGITYTGDDFAEGLDVEIDGENVASEVLVIFGENDSVVSSPPQGTTTADFTECYGRLTTPLTFGEVTNGADAQRLAEFYLSALSAPLVTFSGNGFDFTDAETHNGHSGLVGRPRGPRRRTAGSACVGGRRRR